MTTEICQSILDELQQEVSTLETYADLLQRKLEVTQRLQGIQQQLGESHHLISVLNSNLSTNGNSAEPGNSTKSETDGSSEVSKPKRGGWRASPLPKAQEVYDYYREQGKSRISINDIITDYGLHPKRQYQTALRMLTERLPAAELAEAEKEQGQWVATLT